MGKKIKIVQFTLRIHWPLNDGGNIVSYHSVSELKKKGHEIIICAINTKKHFQDPEVLAHLGTVYSTYINTDLTMLGLLNGYFSPEAYAIQRFYSKEYEAQIIQVLKEHQPDLVLVEGIYLSMYNDVIRQNSTAKILLRSYNIEFEIWERLAHSEKNILKKLFLKNLWPKIKAFEQKHIEDFDGIITITEKDESFFRKEGYKKPLMTINAGVDFSKIKYHPSEEIHNDLCFIGNMEWLPNIQGIEWFMKFIFPIVQQAYPSIVLHVAGKNMSRAMMERKVAGIVFHGTVDSADEFMKAHGILIVPLLSGSGMRLKIIEAMASGKCIVSTSVGAEGIEYVEGESIHIADSIDAFARLIITLIQDTAKIKNTEIKARKLAEEKYNWEKLADKMEEFYLKLL